MKSLTAVQEDPDDSGPSDPRTADALAEIRPGEVGASLESASVKLALSFGTCSTALAGLLVARHFATAWGERLAMHWAPSAEVAVANWGGGFRLGQFITYLVCLTSASVGAVLGALLLRVLAARVSPWLCVLLAAGAGVAAFGVSRAISPLLGTLAGGVLLVATMLTLDGQDDRRSLRALSPFVARTVLACEAVAGGWGFWLVLAPRGWEFAMAFVAASAAFFAGRATKTMTPLRAAVVGSPALFLPILGLFRAPSPLWIIAVLLFSIALAKWKGMPARPNRVAISLFCLAMWSIATICVVPTNMRDYGSINVASHEAQHLGWINSAIRGRLLGADAGMYYGILREYLLAAYCLVAGVTVEHVRVAHILLNLAGFAVFLATAAALFSRRPLLLAGLSYLALFHSPLRAFCSMDCYIAFGWADCLRGFGASAAVVFTCMALARETATFTRLGRRTLLACGVAIALSFLYSQEYGLCAVGATLLATAAAPTLQRAGGRWSERARRALASCGWVLTGLAATLLAVLAFYACFGKAGLLITTTWTTLSVVASGAFGSLDFPVNVGSFSDPVSLFQFPRPSIGSLWDASAEFLLPIAVYLVAICDLSVRAITRRWTATSTVLFGLTAFGASSFRVVIARAEIHHLLSGSAAAILCAGILVDQSLDYCFRVRDVRLPVGLGFAAILLLLTGAATEGLGGLGHQLDMLAKREKATSSKEPYLHPDLPRLGDVNVDADTVALAQFVRENTGPDDPIAILLFMMEGGELYFLCDRPNPTRYDLLAEIITADQRREFLESLQSNPPRLVIGNDASVVGSEVTTYVGKHWPIAKHVGRYTVWLPSPPPTAQN